MRKKSLIVIGIVFFMLIIMVAVSSFTNDSYEPSQPINEPENTNVEIEEPLHKTEVPDGYVGIYTVDDFDYIRTNPYYKYILMNDIDFLDVGEWDAPDIYSEFNGNNYTINNYRQSVPIFNRCFGLIQDLNMNNSIVNGISTLCNSLYAQSKDNAVYRGKLINCDISATINYTISSSKDSGYEAARNVIGVKSIAAIGGLVSEIKAFDDDFPVVDNCSFSGNINVSCKYYKDAVCVGGITGISNHVSLLNCSTNGSISVISSDDEFLNMRFYIGGLTGFAMSDITMTSSKNEMNIEADNRNIRAGGLLGYNDGHSNPVFRECYNKGDIILRGNKDIYGGGTISGGIVGDVFSSLPFMYDCYNVGNISASHAGGLSSSSAIISGCYNVGTINGTEKSGALTADKSEHLEYSYYLNNGVDVTGDGGKYPYVKALSEEEMKNQSSFEWMNFNDVWTFSDGEYKYPTLINCP